MLRFVYLGRASLATAIFIAAVAAWQAADQTSTLIATLTFVASLIFTAASIAYTRVHDGPQTTNFFYGQAVFDLLMVTAVVHVTEFNGPSPLAPLYILVIAMSALLLPSGGVLLVAALGDVLYLAHSLLARQSAYSSAVLLQIGVFGAVALGCGFIAARLRRGEAGREEMAAELAAFRLREADIDRLHTRAERLEAVAELSASLAHEIKNPLASIRSAAELLAKNQNPADTKTLTTLVERESDRLSRLLSEFLDFARTGITRAKRIDLREVAAQAVSVVEANPGKPAGIRIVCLFPSSPLVVVGDDDLLHRAIFNLLLNAAQASPPGAEVRIEAGELAPHQLPPGRASFGRGAVMLKVTDSGSGIPSQIRDRLFEPFVTTKEQGSGLGLSIVHRAVESHHGFVLVDSGDWGTSFSIVLPR
ncbi:MAG: ATP-binding protein, partial [Gemmatimonadota bacterium]|nr:ATP-binding protein [Gemmatimonadota bacterium]